MGDDMEPLKYFEDFLSIPRKSGNEKKISEYLVDFALKNKLEYYVDDNYNVIIKRKSNSNSLDTIILQGHVDMVCASIKEYDFKNNGIDWYIEDGFYKAHGTTLGADNGIGCSIILSILSNKNLKVPNIEAIFTVEEETSMKGAKKLDYSKITGNKMISIDGTDEGVIEVSSAGMVSINITKALNYIPNEYSTYRITIDGLLGGHSGVDIDKHRGNAIKIMGNILNDIDEVYLLSINGGLRDNVIPNRCECILATPNSINVDNSYKNAYPNLKINIEELEKCAKVINREDTNCIIDFIHKLPSGVLTYHESFPQTSLNLAKINIFEQVMNIDLSLRSSNLDDENRFIKEVKSLAHNMEFKIKDKMPFFTFRENSLLRNILIKKYKELYGKDVVLKDVHAGLEGGVFAEKIKNLDVCVIAPNLYDIHTVNEKVEIESVNRVYKWLVEVLKEL